MFTRYDKMGMNKSKSMLRNAPRGSRNHDLTQTFNLKTLNLKLGLRHSTCCFLISRPIPFYSFLYLFLATVGVPSLRASKIDFPQHKSPILNKLLVLFSPFYAFHFFFLLSATVVPQSDPRPMIEPAPPKGGGTRHHHPQGERGKSAPRKRTMGESSITLRMDFFTKYSLVFQFSFMFSIFHFPFFILLSLFFFFNCPFFICGISLNSSCFILWLDFFEIPTIFYWF